MSNEALFAMALPIAMQLVLGGWWARREAVRNKLEAQADENRKERERRLDVAQKELEDQNRDQEIRLVKLEGQQNGTREQVAEIKAELTDIRDNMVRRVDLQALQEALFAHIADALRLTPPRPRRRGRVD